MTSEIRLKSIKCLNFFRDTLYCLNLDVFHQKGSTCTVQTIMMWCSLWNRAIAKISNPTKRCTTNLRKEVEQFLLQSKNCIEISISSVNRSPAWYSFCCTQLYYLVQCEHCLKVVFRQAAFSAKQKFLLFKDQLAESRRQKKLSFDAANSA